MFEKNPRDSELVKDPQLIGQKHETNPKSKEEACTILQAENQGLVSGVICPNLKVGDPNYDYKTNNPTKFAEVKVPRDDILEDADWLGRKSALQRGKDGSLRVQNNLTPRLIRKSKVIYLEEILHYKDSINQLIHPLES